MRELPCMSVFSFFSVFFWVNSKQSSSCILMSNLQNWKTSISVWHFSVTHQSRLIKAWLFHPKPPYSNCPPRKEQCAQTEMLSNKKSSKHSMRMNFPRKAAICTIKSCVSFCCYAKRRNAMDFLVSVFSVCLPSTNRDYLSGSATEGRATRNAMHESDTDMNAMASIREQTRVDR